MVFSVVGLSFALNPLEGVANFDDGYTGTAVLPYLKLSIGARSLAMGGNNGAVEEQALQMFWNPAGIADVKGYWSSIHHAEYLGEFRHEYIATTIPLAKWGTLGLFGNAFVSTPFDNARDIEEENVLFSTLDLSMGFNYARELIPHLFLAGFSLKYLKSNIEEVTGSGYALDLGMEFKLRHGIRLATSAQNISNGFTYKGGTGIEEKLPAVLRLSLGRPMDVLPYSWNLGWQKSNDGMHQSSFGYERRFYDWLLLRGGYYWEWNNTENHWSRGVSMGVGFSVSTITFDYGMQLQGDLGWHHAVSLHLSDLKDRYSTEYSHIEHAQDWFARGECDRAQTYARLALRENPGDLQAMVVLQSCEKRVQILSGDYLTFFYTANTMGHYTPNWEDGAPLGGLSRRATLLKTLREKLPQSITIDGGKILTLGSQTTSDSIVWDAYALMNYSALAWDFENDSAKTLAMDTLPWVFSNPDLLHWHNELLLERGGRKVSILNLRQEKKWKSYKEIINYLEDFYRRRSERPDIEVLLWDMSLEWLQNVLERFPQNDLIILSGNSNRLDAPLQFGNTKVVSPGLFGSHLGQFTFYFKGAKQKSWEHKLLPINTTLAPDPEIAALFQEKNLAGDDIYNPSPIPKWKFGSFVFLKEQSNGMRDIYLEDVKKNFHYRLSQKTGKYRSLFLSHSRSLITFLQGDTLFKQKTNSKKKVSLVKEKVFSYQWDNYENWIYYKTIDEDGLWIIKRIRPSGMSMQTLIKSRKLIGNFHLHPYSEFITYQEGELGLPGIKHQKLGTGLLDSINAPGTMAKDPQYSHNGRYLAYLVANPYLSQSQRTWDLAVYDLTSDTTIMVTEGAEVNRFWWNPIQEKIIFQSGLNLQDLNEYDFEVNEEKKVIDYSDTPAKGEGRVQFYKRNNEMGVLVEVHEGGFDKIKWVSLESKKQEEVIQKSGNFKLNYKKSTK
jgi:hypothetical protein